jgi:hypothetical protein
MNGTHKCGQEICKHGNIVTEHKDITKCEAECTNKLNNNNYNFPYLNSVYLHLTYTLEELN